MPPADPYVLALRVLARRELTVRQVRDRLEQAGHDAVAVDAAIARLLHERALDDARAARAIARHEIVIRHRGPLRARRALEAAGVTSDLAARAIEDALGETDPAAAMTAALATRWPGDAPITGRRDVARLYRFLVGRGFEPDRVMALLRARRGSRAVD
ncbi:MAG: hypothetical protein FJW23_12595 [Acidimicrobiia bacterium]|nr:hypothetical protein [Acidimicrobiia bacterium]